MTDPALPRPAGFASPVAADTIFIRDFRHSTRIGVYPWERLVPQSVQIDLEFELPGRHAADSRRLEDTIDYSRVVARMRDLLDHHDETLLESLSERIAATLLAEFGMPRLRLSLAKLALLPGVRALGITIERHRD